MFCQLSLLPYWSQSLCWALDLFVFPCISAQGVCAAVLRIQLGFLNIPVSDISDIMQKLGGVWLTSEPSLGCRAIYFWHCYSWHKSAHPSPLLSCGAQRSLSRMPRASKISGGSLSLFQAFRTGALELCDDPSQILEKLSVHEEATHMVPQRTQTTRVNSGSANPRNISALPHSLTSQSDFWPLP